MCAQVDRDHWLAAGLAQSLNFIVTGGDIYQPLRLGDGVNVVRFAEQTLMTQVDTFGKILASSWLLSRW